MNKGRKLGIALFIFAIYCSAIGLYPYGLKSADIVVCNQDSPVETVFNYISTGQAQHLGTGENTNSAVSVLISFSKNLTSEFFDKAHRVELFQRESVIRTIHCSNSIILKFRKPDIIYPFNYFR